MGASVTSAFIVLLPTAVKGCPGSGLLDLVRAVSFALFHDQNVTVAHLGLTADPGTIPPFQAHVQHHTLPVFMGLYYSMS